MQNNLALLFASPISWVETPDAFLKGFTPSYFINNNLIDIAYATIANNGTKQLGDKSAMGSAWDAGDYVVKIMNVCPTPAQELEFKRIEKEMEDLNVEWNELKQLQKADIDMLDKNAVKKHIIHMKDVYDELKVDVQLGSMLSEDERQNIITQMHKIEEQLDAISVAIKKGRKMSKSQIINRVISIDDLWDELFEKFRNNMLDNLCDVARNGDLIFRIPSSYDRKQIVLAPNYLTENIIGMLLASNNIRRYTTAFPSPYQFRYDIITKQTVTVMEKLISLKPLISNTSRVIYIMMEIAHALQSTQSLARYTHYDLHSGNIMARSKNNNVVKIYAIGGKYVYTLFPFETVIIDFGFSRYETKEAILIPSVRLIRDGAQDYSEFCEFNPYVDLFTALHYTLMLTGKNLGFRSVSSPPGLSSNGLYGTYSELEDITDRLLSKFLNVSDDKKDIAQALDRILGDNEWRPLAGELAKYDPVRGINPVMTPNEFLTELVHIINEGPAHNNAIELANILRNQEWGMAVSDSLIDLTGINGILGSNIYHLPSKNESMNTAYLPIRTLMTRIDRPSQIMKNITIISRNGAPPGVRTTILPFNHTTEESSRIRGDLSNQYYHVAFIDQHRNSSGYKFRFDCCRVDIRSFFRSQHISSGIAINASFFNINTNYFPIGLYKAPDMVVNTKPPEPYNKIYGMLGINRDGKLDISKNISLNATTGYTQYISAGPVLVWYGQIMITPDTFNEEVDGTPLGFQGNVKLWQSRLPRDDEDEESIVFTDGIPNSSMIPPGSLSHSSNPNPRTAVCIDVTGNVMFVYVEGRGRRGDGMDLAQLAELCKSLGATKAINVDGGNSSQMIWRAPNQEYINQFNPTHDYAYAVGTILSFVKEK